ncbi:hypothetical protein [Burkholderia gladioli]|uniref:hypothetical protein n=1 Tax=Burkholderia gladioli TaxID=28095 RepID=UPI00163EB60F|nr:hypothetical protein [Burkholderia gladioli]
MPHALRDQLIEPIPLPAADIAQCKTYRDACLLAWDRRTFLKMQKTHLSAMTGIPAPHVTLYFHRSPVDRHGRRRPVLPADFIARVEFALGNTAISQFLEYERATVRESMRTGGALLRLLFSV